jgi:hypothetical protein
MLAFLLQTARKHARCKELNLNQYILSNIDCRSTDNDEENAMRRRLYFVLPDIKSAHTLMDELLLQRIDEDHIHFHAD